MNKFCKVIGYTALGAVSLAYLSFLFVLPNAIDLNQYKPEAQKLAKEQANLDVNFENLKIITTPLLGVGVKADDISIKLPDGSVLFSADNFKTRISLPSLALLTVKVSCLEVNNPYVNLEIQDNKQFKVVQLVEDLLNQGKEQKLEQGEEEEKVTEESWFDPSWIRIKVPNITLNNYKVLVNDLKNKHYLDLHGEKLTLGYFNGKSAKIKTYAELFSDENKNITANIDINTFLPTVEPSLDAEDDPAERIDIPFVNPVEMYRNYDLKANLDTKLLVRERRGNISSYGHFNIENITLNVGHLTLPESYLRAKTFGTTVDLDTNIYPATAQNIELLGKLNYGKHPKLDMSIKTAEIKFNDLLILARAFLDSLSIPNELSAITATGSLKSDCYIKTNFKKLKSNGSIVVKDGGLNVKGVGKVLANTNINILLDNNVLNIKDSSLFVNESKISIDGKIDEKSVADISVKANKIPLPILFKAFAPKEIRNAYNFRSGDVSLDLNVNGELKKAIATAKAGLDNLNIGDKAGNFVVTDKKFSSELFADAKTLTAKLTNEGFVFALPKTKSQVSVPLFETEVADNNVVIKENKINFNEKSTITYSGEVIDYNKLKSIVFKANGAVSTDDLIKVIGKEFKPYIHSQGSIPVKLTVDGNGKKQTLFAQALADSQNFITPVDFTELQGKNTSLQSVVDFKGNRIKIKKTGLYERNVSVDEEGNEVVSLNDVLDIDGTIAGDRINLIKINLAKALNGKIFVFPKSSFKVDGKAYVFGETSSPRFRGGFNVQNLAIPELLLDLRNASLKFAGHNADFEVDDLILNGSDIQVNGTMSLLPASVLTISKLDVASRYMNVDKLMVVSDKAMKYVPQSTSTTSTSSSAQADIPVWIKTGSIKMDRIISGNIDVKNTTGKISLVKNVFYLNNLKTNVFKGSVNGNISMNLLSTLMNIKVSGTGLDVEQALQDAAAMKDTLSGTADFKADISLKGATYEEQMQSLKGTVDFDVKDGQFGPFGKLENLILAENIRESAFFQTALGGMLSGLLTIDTTHFSELTGSLSFEDGICHIDPITSLGNILSLHVFGDFDLLRNYADMKVRARMASLVSNLLGPLGAINPANLLNSAASLNVVTAKAFSIFCEMVPEEEMAILPSFANKYVDNAATKFQIVVRGDVAKPLTLVKSFKWLATATEYNNAVDYVNSLPEPIEGEENASIEQTIADTAAIEAEKQTFGYKVKHLFSKDEDSAPTLKPQAVIEETNE
jgi:hypothetical protein